MPSTTPPRATPPSLATRLSAEPSSGPEHALQTSPSTPPSRKDPSREPLSSRADAALALVAIGSIQRVKRSPRAGISVTSAKAISSAAPAVRTVSESTPRAGPSEPSTIPMPAKEGVIPTPVATGAIRLRCKAPPSTKGSNGNTQGDRCSPPGRSTRLQVPTR